MSSTEGHWTNAREWEILLHPPLQNPNAYLRGHVGNYTNHSTIDNLMAHSAHWSFSINKGCLILKQLASGDNVDHIQLCFYMLQVQCKGAVNHIRQAFNSMWTIFSQYNNTLTNQSYNSMFSDILSNYGHLPPRLEVTRHMLREDYQREMPEHLWSYKDKLVEEWVKSWWEKISRPYQRKLAHYPQFQYEEQSDSPHAWSCSQGSLPKTARSIDQSQPSVFGSISLKDCRHTPPPTSISMAMSHNHPLSHFLALNSNQGGNAGTGFDDEDLHNPWIMVHSTHTWN